MESYLDEAAVGRHELCQVCVTMVAQHNQASMPGSQLLNDGQHLWVHCIPCGHHQNGHVLVHLGNAEFSALALLGGLR